MSSFRFRVSSSQASAQHILCGHLQLVLLKFDCRALQKCTFAEMGDKAKFILWVLLLCCGSAHAFNLTFDDEGMLNPACWLNWEVVFSEDSPADDACSVSMEDQSMTVMMIKVLSPVPVDAMRLRSMQHTEAPCQHGDGAMSSSSASEGGALHMATMANRLSRPPAIALSFGAGPARDASWPGAGMYLNSVLESIGSDSGSYSAEDIYRLNEAIFNLPEEEDLDDSTTELLFKAVQKIKKAFAGGKCDRDPNFYYDYIALLSTMQNQHFFGSKQTKLLLDWLHEAVKSPPGEDKSGAKSSSSTKDIARIEAENAKMIKEIEQMQELTAAVQVLQGFKLPKNISTTSSTGDKSQPSQSAAKRKRRGKGSGGGGGSG
eukprot:s303_g7.t1